MRLKFGLMIVGLITALCWPGDAHASKSSKVSSVLFSCNVSFHATGKSVYLGVGGSALAGKGTITCYDFLTGATQKIPIKITARGPGAGLGVTGLAISGGATGLGINESPESLLGRYLVVRGGAAVGIGAAAAVGLRLSKGSINLDVSIQAQKGLGAGIDLLSVELEADGEKQIEQAPAEVPEAPVVSQDSTSQAATVTVPVRVLYVQENQPVHLVDGDGRLLQVLYLKKSR